MTSDVDRFYRTLAREAADAIIYADVNGIITFWNKGAERIFGFSEREAIGQSFDIIIPCGNVIGTALRKLYDPVRRDTAPVMS
jgi:PAS domain S-box-containing protein